MVYQFCNSNPGNIEIKFNCTQVNRIRLEILTGFAVSDRFAEASEATAEDFEDTVDRDLEDNVVEDGLEDDVVEAVAG